MRRSLPVVLSLLGLLAASLPAQAISGIEGTFEYAFDAPWRIEPSPGPDGSPTWGAIPIQLTIHDANLAQLDRGLRTVYTRSDDGKFEKTTVPLPGPQRLGRFCSLTITDTRSGDRSHYAFQDLAEVERSRGVWRDDPSDPEPTLHQVCRLDQGEQCPDADWITGTSEWYALAWYPVPADATYGPRLELAIEMDVSRDPREPCAPGDPARSITLRNHVAVELGREPLPRFGPGWLYGDLHYHSQGTDNEGESGHNYRGVVRAMGALGLDFAFATEHASASDQVVDGDVWLSGNKLKIRESRIALRDMSDARFRTLLGLLHGPDGVNREAARRGVRGGDPQTARVAGTVPQIFLGGEVDVIPETDRDYPRITYPFGNGLTYDIGNLCGGWNANLADWFGACNIVGRFEPAENGVLLRDIQGLNDSDYARWHLVYLPRSSSDANAFVASRTGRYGGGGRRLVEPHDGEPGVAGDIRAHGYAFIAHPLSGMGSGGPGPDSTPWTDHGLRKAFAEPSILGLQLWNENTRNEHALASDEVTGYERPDHLLGTQKPDESVREGFYTGLFELDASGFLWSRGEYVNEREGGQLFGIAHGTYTWDRMNLWGLDPEQTAGLSWLEAGEPRRVLMAGGSDAHGDFNYRREGYFLGDTKLTSTAIGTPRNLVDVGVPLPTFDPGTVTTGTITDGYGGTTDSTAVSSTIATDGLASELAGEATWVTEGEWSVEGSPERPVHSQTQVVDALAAGAFSVTDGPALRIAVDRNRNGEIDDEDTPMGGVVDLYGEDELPLLLEWKSTRDFGPVGSVELVVGVQGGGRTRLYAPANHAPRAEGLPSSEAVESDFDFWQYERGADGYWRVDGQPLRVGSGPDDFAGSEAVTLDLRALTAGRGVPGERYFVRAVATTRLRQARHAFTNPIWAVTRDAGTCPTDAPRAIDGDGDGLPDGCDPCPTVSADDPYSVCLGGGGVSTVGIYEEGISDIGSGASWGTSADDDPVLESTTMGSTGSTSFFFGSFGF